MSNEEFQQLKEKLEDHDRRIAELENILKIEKKVPIVKSITEIQKLSEKLGIPVERFGEIFDIEESVLTLIKHIGENRKEKIQNIAVLTSFGYKIYFGKEDVLAQEIRRNVVENRISLNNFGTFLNELIPSLLRRKGKLKSPKTTYKLTLQGEVKAEDLIREIVNPPECS